MSKELTIEILIRIKGNKIERNANNTKWETVYTVPPNETLKDLIATKTELLLYTDKKLVHSINEGKSWNTKSTL